MIWWIISNQFSNTVPFLRFCSNGVLENSKGILGFDFLNNEIFEVFSLINIFKIPKKTFRNFFSLDLLWIHNFTSKIQWSYAWNILTDGRTTDNPSLEQRTALLVCGWVLRLFFWISYSTPKYGPTTLHRRRINWPTRHRLSLSFGVV